MRDYSRRLITGGVILAIVFIVGIALVKSGRSSDTVRTVVSYVFSFGDASPPSHSRVPANQWNRLLGPERAEQN